MPKLRPVRYNDAAVILHWMIALLIISLLAMGKFMHGLEDDDPLKFDLVQWHKSFGITVMLLIVIRIIWRLTYTAPAHPENAPGWEKRAAGFTHVALYALMIIMPLSGWLLVSASEFKLDTVLFNAVTWPHVPGHEKLQALEMAGQFYKVHEIGSGIMILLLLMHIAGALKHHLITNDDVLRRMLPDWQSGTFKPKLLTTLAAIVLAAGGLALIASTQKPVTVVTANNSVINFSTVVSGEQTPGEFLESTINLTLDENNPAASSLTAEVVTSSVLSDNLQANGSLPDEDWFDTENFPTANFQSTEFSQVDGQYFVKGDLTIKDTTIPAEFPLVIESDDDRRVARGSFVINRFDFKLGANDQPDVDYVAAEITIDFSFDL
jgi:cytochrome b561